MPKNSCIVPSVATRPAIRNRSVRLRPRRAASPSSTPNETHARQDAEHGVNRDGIGPAEQPAAQLPPPGMEVDVERRLPHRRAGMIIERLDQQLAVAPAKVLDAEDRTHTARTVSAGCRGADQRIDRQRQQRGRGAATRPPRRTREAPRCRPATTARSGQIGRRPEAPHHRLREQRGDEVQDDDQKGALKRPQQAVARGRRESVVHCVHFNACAHRRPNALASFRSILVIRLRGGTMDGAHLHEASIAIRPTPGSRADSAPRRYTVALLRRRMRRKAVIARMIAGRSLPVLPRFGLYEVRLPLALLAVPAAALPDFSMCAPVPRRSPRSAGTGSR